MTSDAERLLRSLPEDTLHANGVPDPENARHRERAAELVEANLRELLLPGGLRASGLGPAWSSDLDAHVRALPERSRLLELGWIPLDGLLGRLGSPDTGRWAVVDDGGVVGALDLHLTAPPDPVATVLGRARRRREVRAREVLELRGLVREGAELPEDAVVRAAARAEAALGGDLLRRWRRDPPQLPPVRVPSLRRYVRRPRRHRKVVVAVSGVDGAGKSTLCRSVAVQLRRAGLPSEVVSTRPGMRIGWLDRAARLAKRVLRQDSRAAVGAVAAGEGSGVRSRRGALGWVWALLVTLSFLRDVRRGHRRGRGVLLFDRHLLDALVTLEVGYEGVRLGVHRALVRRWLPRADLTVYLDLPADVAVARKPDPLFGEAAVRRQLERYTALVDRAPGVRRLDATLSADRLAAEVLALVTSGAEGRRNRRRGSRASR